ncbi:MAG: hypothetical protein QME07_03610 [bacterium]|nr:hypothetical protein [bacterium]
MKTETVKSILNGFRNIPNERYLWFAVRYVERNPIRAKIVDNAEDYPCMVKCCRTFFS